MEQYIKSELSGFLSKSGRQKYSAWDHGDQFYECDG